MKKVFIITVFMLPTIMLVTSCGTRKVEKTRAEESSKTEVLTNSIVEKEEDTNVKKKEITTVDDKTETTTKETIYEPIDPTKSAFIIEANGTKINLENSKKTVRETSQKKDIKKENTIKSVVNSKIKALEKVQSESISNSKKKSEIIKIDKKSWNVWNLFWLLIPAALYWIWKNKTKIIEWFVGAWWV
jgi:hypothetical protein